MIDHALPEDLVQYADLTRRFVRNELRPHEEAVERDDEVPEQLRRRLRQLALQVGLYGFNMPQEAGGPGLSYLAQVVIREQLGQVNMGLADLVGRPPKALLACNPEQRERFLLPVMRAERTCAFALTEPGAGSDAAAMQTRAVRDAHRDGWRLSGTKHFISHGNCADFLIVIARAVTAAESLPTAFVVEQGTAGQSVGRVHRKMGWRGYPVAELVFDDVFVPDTNVLGQPGEGLRLALRNIAEARMGVAAHCLGMAQRALDYVTPHLHQRRQFGRPLAAYQGLQWMVADMALQIEQSRALVYAAARALDAAGSAGPGMRAAVSMAKLSATEMVGRVADAALQLMGGAGYMAEGPIEMIYRDARAFRIGEGTSEIQRNQIARDILGGGRSMPEAQAIALDVTGWSFGRFIDETGSRFAEREALIASDHRQGPAPPRTCTYAQLRDDVHALQWALQDLGLRAGDKVGVLLSSFPEWIQLLFAVTRMGCAFMPISTRFRARELRHVLHHSEATLLVTVGHYLGHDYAETVQDACGQRSADGFAAMPHLRHLVEVGSRSLPGAVDGDQLLARGRQLLGQRGVPPRADDPASTAILFYTSGTTSFPKGVPLTHANLLPHSVRAGQLLGIVPGERVLSLYPFFGISGGANKVLSTLGCGGCLVFQDAWRAAEANTLLDQLACTVLHAVDVQVRELVALRRQAPAPVPERRGTIAFMATLDEALAREMGELLGLRRFIHPYGMTETNPMILRNALDDGFEQSVRPGGRVAPGVAVRVVDPVSGAEQAPGMPGEITVRGETVMAGYYKDPEATRVAFVDGWFRTGDQGVRDADGLIFYLGRLKDMLKVGGFNVAPQEIESFLRTLEGVQDAAVTGVPDARLGEAPVAFVVPAPGVELDAGSVMARCRGQIANFKVPHAVHIVDALPYHTAANGSKLQRHVLREWAGQRGGAAPS